MLPRKSASRYPLRLALPTLLVACSESLEFWAENLVSLRFPVGLGVPVAVVVNGIDPNELPIPVPGLVDLSDVAAEADGVAKIVLESVQELLLKLALQMARDDYVTRRERQR